MGVPFCLHGNNLVVPLFDLVVGVGVDTRVDMTGELVFGDGTLGTDGSGGDAFNGSITLGSGTATGRYCRGSPSVLGKYCGFDRFLKTIAS